MIARPRDAAGASEARRRRRGTVHTSVQVDWQLNDPFLVPRLNGVRARGRRGR